jgi:excisionase family DNA binding protein
MSTQLLTTDEAAEVLRMTTNRLSRLVRRGEVPHVLLPGDEVRFDERDLSAWVESRKAGGAPLAEVAR